MSEIQSPRGSLRLTPRPDGVAAIFTCEYAEWLQAASDTIDFVSRLRHPSIPDVRGVVRHDDRLELSSGLRPGSAPVGRSIDDVAAVADFAAALRASIAGS